MISYIQLPDKNYIHFKRPGKPGVSLINDHNMIIRKLAEKIIKKSTEFEKEVWYTYEHYPSVFIGKQIDKNSKLIGFGRDRSILGIASKLKSPFRGLVGAGEDRFSLLIHPDEYINTLGYVSAYGVISDDEYKEMINIISKFSDVEIARKHSVFHAQRYGHNKSFMRNLPYEHLPAPTQDRLIIISNILYWLKTAPRIHDADVVLIENTSQDVIDDLINLFPDIQFIGSANTMLKEVI